MDDILDFDWVLSHETQIEEKEATLFQQCVSMDLLLIGSAMLFENNIPFQIKDHKPNNEDPLHLGQIREIHVNEKDLEKASKLLDQLLNKSSAYPKKIPHYYLDSELTTMLELNSNPYKEILIKTELERRGIYLESKEEDKVAGINSLMIILFAIVIFGLMMAAR